MYAVIYGSCDPDAKKVIQEDISKYGFEAYRLLSREYDPVNSDTAYNLLQSILAIGRWVLKSVIQEERALREAQTRIHNLERRDGPIDPAYMKIITDMIYSILSAESKKFVIAEKSRDDFKLMRKAIMKLRVMENNVRPQRMDVGSLQAVDEYGGYPECDWVAWQDAGRPEDDDDWEELSPSLDAINRKGKGKGKGGKGKGKGKGKYREHNQQRQAQGAP